MLCLQGPPRSDCKAMRSDFNCNMQKHSKCIIFLICLQFSIINILYAKFIANTILKPKQVICLEKLSFGVYILAMSPPGNMAESLIYQLLPLMLFANRALEERPTHGVSVNEYIMLLVTVYRERAFDKQSSSKIMCDETQQPL